MLKAKGFATSIALLQLLFAEPAVSEDSREKELLDKLNSTLDEKFGKDALKRVAEQNLIEAKNIYKHEYGIRPIKEIVSQLTSNGLAQTTRESLDQFLKSPTERNRQGAEMSIYGSKKIFIDNLKEGSFYHDRVNLILVLLMAVEFGEATNKEKAELMEDIKLAERVSRSLNDDSLLKSRLSEIF